MSESPAARAEALLENWTRPPLPSLWSLRQFHHAVGMAVVCFAFFGLHFGSSWYRNDLEDHWRALIDMGVLLTTIVSVYGAFAAWSIQRLRRAFRVGVPTIASLVDFSRSHAVEKVTFDYAYDGARFRSVGKIKPNRHLELFRDGMELIVLVDPERPCRAVIPEELELAQIVQSGSG